LTGSASAIIDVLGVGVVAVDDVLVVAEYPEADQKVEVLERRRVCGGLSATALVAAARLGVRCAYAGQLDRDHLSTFVLGELEREGIDVASVAPRRGARPIHSVVVVDRSGGSRTIFFDQRDYAGPASRSPAASSIQRARVVLVDHVRLDGMVRVARVARAANVAVVADFEGGMESARFPELLALVDHLVVPASFAAALTGWTNPADAAEALWSDTRAAVVVTSGSEGCWYRDGASEVSHCPAFPATAVDTTGCGDIFHGAYAAALARGLALAERVRFAAAAAALAVGSYGGQTSAPRFPEVSALLAQHSRT
jgi:sugar/nucleoside kinase (ribokinase family)